MDELSFVPGVASGPIRGLVWLAQVLSDEAEQELKSRAHAARRELAEAEAAHAAGDISTQELRRIEAQYLDQVTRTETAGEIAERTTDENR